LRPISKVPATSCAKGLFSLDPMLHAFFFLFFTDEEYQLKSGCFGLFIGDPRVEPQRPHIAPARLIKGGSFFITETNRNR
jgi:hypothetical protein